MTGTPAEARARLQELVRRAVYPAPAACEVTVATAGPITRVLFATGRIVLETTGIDTDRVEDAVAVLLGLTPPREDELSPELTDLLDHPGVRVWERATLPPAITALLGAELGAEDGWIVFYRDEADCYVAKHLAHALGTCSWWIPTPLRAMYPGACFVMVVPSPWACGACSAQLDPQAETGAEHG